VRGRARSGAFLHFDHIPTRDRIASINKFFLLLMMWFRRFGRSAMGTLKAGNLLNLA
jgi:hypothetical protein